MVRGQDEKKKRRARPCVEPLDDRVVLSGASALATHAMATAATHAHQGIIARFDATVDRFEDQAVTNFDLAGRRIDRSVTTNQGDVRRDAARLQNGTIPSARTAAVQLSRSTDALARALGQFADRSELRWNQTARTLDNRLDQAVGRDVGTDPALGPAAQAAEANLATRNAELASDLAQELAAARTNLQAAIGSAQAAAAADLAARPATARPAAPAVRVVVHHASPVQHQLGVRAAVPSAATGTAATSPILATGVTTAAQAGTAGSPVNGAGPGLVPATMGALPTGGIAGSTGSGAFGVGTVGGNGDFVGGTAPSPVTGTTGAGVDTGLDTFGIGTGFGVGSGIDMTPNGDGPFF
jgi:hypothetical protein